MRKDMLGEKGFVEDIERAVNMNCKRETARSESQKISNWIEI